MYRLEPATGPPLVLNATDTAGVQWAAALDGWDSPDLRASLTPRPGDHGSLDGASTYAERVLEVKGLALASTPEERARAVDRLTRASNLWDTYARFVVTEDPERFVTVRRSGKLNIDEDYLGFEFSLGLLAPDPRKYSLALGRLTVGLPIAATGRTYSRTYPRTYGPPGSSGTFLAENVGNIDTRPVVYVVGPSVNPTLENATTGELIAFAITVPAGHVLAVDFDARTITMDGANRRGVRVQGTHWWTLVPGVNEVRYRADTWNADSTATMEWRSAWI